MTLIDMLDYSVYPFVEPYSNRTCESPGSRSRTFQKLESVKVNLDRYYPAIDLCEVPLRPLRLVY